MHIPRKLLLSAALALVLVVTLLAGLKPKGYRFCNEVTWTRDHAGIGIGPIGIAYSRDSLSWFDQNSADSGFTIEMSVTVNRFQVNDIAGIVSFWDGTFPEPLMIGQWENRLIVRVRDIHAKKGYREFDSDTILKRGKKLMVQIVFARSKTVMYADGIRTGDSLSGCPLSKYDIHGRLVLGNSARADRPWSGEIYGLALYQRKLSSEETASRFRQWDSLGRAFFPPTGHAAHYFRFNEKKGVAVRDCANASFDLYIPPVFHIVKKRILVGPWDDFKWKYSYFFDCIINLLGFMPLGFFLFLFFFRVAAVSSWKKSLLYTIVTCFMISLGIELVQVYLPTRSSQLSDLFCNTAGGMIGGYAGFRRRA